MLKRDDGTTDIQISNVGSGGFAIQVVFKEKDALTMTLRRNMKR